LSLVLCLQGCITGRPTPTSSPASYFWLPLLGVSDDGTARTRALIDAMLTARGYVPGNALALSISTDADRRDDGSLGLGAYAGGYAYYTPPPTPRGSILLEAFDARTLRPVWRVTLSGAAMENEAELALALDAALRMQPGLDPG
jgi:hypothetical protein